MCLFKFTATTDFTKLQFDLFANLKVEKVIYKGQELPYKREFNAVFITFPKPIQKAARKNLRFIIPGNPTIAKRAPWDGGIDYNTDSLGNPWVSTACQGMGASVWWPNKDQQADEVDSALISITRADRFERCFQRPPAQSDRSEGWQYPVRLVCGQPDQ